MCGHETHFQSCGFSPRSMYPVMFILWKCRKNILRLKQWTYLFWFDFTRREQKCNNVLVQCLYFVNFQTDFWLLRFFGFTTEILWFTPRHTNIKIFFSFEHLCFFLTEPQFHAIGNYVLTQVTVMIIQRLVFFTKPCKFVIK